MKSITFLISFLLVMGLSAAHAQIQVKSTGGQKTRDLLFPDFAKDQARFKVADQLQAAKPAEALITSSQALRARIFKSDNVAGSARTASPAAAKAETQALGSSKSAADAMREIKAQLEAEQAKIVAPKLEQGTEPQPKSKN